METKIKADKFQIGGKIEFALKGKFCKTTAIRDEGDWMLFLFDEYIDYSYMNEKSDASKAYEDSGLRMYLQYFTGFFARKYTKHMMPFENGDLLRILSATEMFGADDGSGTHSGQIEWMKDRMHRIAYLDGDLMGAWTSTKVSDTDFVSVTWCGYKEIRCAYENLGVRPVFRMFHPLQYEKHRLERG